MEASSRVELLDAIELLETTRGPGSPFPTERHPALKRLALLKSRCHVYFEINDEQQRIEICTSGMVGANEPRSSECSGPVPALRELAALAEESSPAMRSLPWRSTLTGNALPVWLRSSAGLTQR